MLVTVIDFIDEGWLVWVISAVISLVLMIIFGVTWESSGSIDEERKTFLIVFSKFFAIMLGASGSLFVVSAIINIIRAIISG
ncbi:hypothetical protein HQ571_06460 [Candidatus Kuenenbacteria bacterium]|nr:hypothetical protein [Candidatus Kuenenbacteria bacterium]